MNPIELRTDQMVNICAKKGRHHWVQGNQGKFGCIIAIYKAKSAGDMGGEL